jgi:hypothetical protein
MKNVKKLLIFAAISTFVFASSTRTEALGGAGYWADDYANIWNYPASVNDHNVAYTSGNNFTSIFDHNGTKWGFAGGQSDNEVVNMYWGNGTMGARFGLAMAPEVPAVTCAEEEEDCVAAGIVESDMSMNIGFGMPLAGGDFGFTYNDAGTIGLNHRRAQSLFVWENMLINVSITPEDFEDGASDQGNTEFSVDCYTNRSYEGGTSGLFALGFHYGAKGATSATADDAPDATMNLVWNFAVESDMTDWGTLRVGYKTMHDLGGGANSAGSLSVGLGFNYGSFSLDMDISNSADDLLNDPVKWAAGRNNDDSTLSSSWTISYNW